MATRTGKVDPQDARRVKHTHIGIWDLYEECQTDKQGSSILETYTWIRESSPYAVRMLRDIFSIRRVQILLPIFLIVEVLGSLMPAISLWYIGQLLRLIEPAMETRTVDTTVFVHVAVGHLACAVATRLFKYLRRCTIFPMDISITQFYAGRTFHSIVSLDVPTYTQFVHSGKLGIPDSDLDSTSSVECEIIQVSTNITMTVVRLLSQFLVLVTVLREQQDGLLLAILSFSQPIFHWDGTRKAVARSLVWVATTTNKDFIRMNALKLFVHDPRCRKEVVTGNLSEHITAQFRESVQRVGGDAVDFIELDRILSIKDSLSAVHILRETMHMLPQIIFTLRVVQKPMTLPLYLVSLVLMYQVSNSFSSPPFSESPFSQFVSLAKKFTYVRTVYEIENVRNQVVDGTESFPEDKQSLRSGISIEFRNVTFQYPGNEKYAFHNVSFKIGAGQLCVIVGINGSGKSTVLKLISRVYDPTEGTILIDDRDIKTLKLADLRSAMSILFQDYAHFPVPIRENIGLGNPALANDDDKIREAARLGGAEEFIDDLPDGFNTSLEGPSLNHYSRFEGSSSFGPPIDFSFLRSVAGIRSTYGPALSGGQMQRLAVSRTFMRSLPSETEPSAGMLLFDEPSASLDPKAEHTLFERLRKLRGSKTIIFSTHRFGNLTRHADLILYMDESVHEQGTHDELMRKGGEYAHVWNLQAEPFL
ncbi:P-loop containing nucleoside triphosphate hydrolase protein [Suillus clintonianus]|uniref:P-loop containing nucleoside triphosphate hydrolase protein n=1 Tax=Suillus clintonianus TaxID=1904413 RepID=UPI001B85C284|nr:P-loop containing nucleoside triphosphate hydrolase protein [Suillus clintonianus]KAG2132379.1 P-loop containing nucleoside triphosphate hydrolase protein [Suillus clintonianus]